MTVGKNIQKIRKEKGLTQKQLGALCTPKIAESTIRRYELELLNPKIETIERIAAALGTTTDSLREKEERNTGSNIKRIRTRQGLSESELAKLTGLSEINIKNYEAGKEIPSLEALHAIADTLGHSLVGLVEDWNIYPESKEFDLSYFAVSYDDFKTGIVRQAEHEERILLENYRRLNSDGQAEARKRVQELTEIKKYTEQDPPQYD